MIDRPVDYGLPKLCKPIEKNGVVELDSLTGVGRRFVGLARLHSR